MRMNPDTKEYEFAFLFAHNPEQPLGWWDIDQVREAANWAVKVVTDREFEAIRAREFPQYDKTEDAGP